MDDEGRPYLSWTILRESFRAITKLGDKTLEKDKTNADRLRNGFNLLRVYTKTGKDSAKILNENIDQLDIFVEDCKVINNLGQIFDYIKFEFFIFTVSSDVSRSQR